MKAGEAVKFPGTSGLFAVILKKERDRVAFMFSDGEVKWFQKDVLEKKNETS